MSLPQRDEDWLREITADLQRNPFRDLPDDDGDGYIPQVTVKQVPQKLYEDTVRDVLTQNEELCADNARLVEKRAAAIADAGRITARLNLALMQVHDLARLRRTLERSRWYWRLAALAGWALWLVALVRR